ncbi:YbhB/YbcL family Raf kinase inhibitor-like protein [Thiohalospira sp.]|uniref:YbhB/YbcL family Raf kinase inhibitor-like protein n=1 Tax=Thiohalospira sp. TaxID=3080549 RepID=UPI00397F187F
MSLTITSPAFADGDPIPAVYTCDGEDRSPPLLFAGLPEGTRSLALVVDDPDAPDPAAPRMTFVHWVLYNLPPEASGLPEGIRDPAELPHGTQEGRNNWDRPGYGGPCPPVGRHRYFHRLYALDCRLPDLSEPLREELDGAMEGHILAEATLVGTYQRE